MGREFAPCWRSENTGARPAMESRGFSCRNKAQAEGTLTSATPVSPRGENTRIRVTLGAELTPRQSLPIRDVAYFYQTEGRCFRSVIQLSLPSTTNPGDKYEITALKSNLGSPDSLCLIDSAPPSSEESGACQLSVSIPTRMIPLAEAGTIWLARWLAQWLAQWRG